MPQSVQRFEVSVSDEAEHMARVGNFLALEYRQFQRRFCDVELTVEGEKIQVHSCVLMTHSRMMQKALSAETVPIKVSVESLSKETVQILIQYMYYGSVEIAVPMLEKVLLAVSHFRMDEMRADIETRIIDLVKGPTDFPGIARAVFNPAAQIGLAVKQKMLGLFLAFLPNFTNKELNSLSSDFIKYAVDTSQVSPDEKIVLINAALTWIYCAADSAVRTRIDAVHSRVVLHSLDDVSNDLFRHHLEKCLTQHSLNRSLRAFVLRRSDNEVCLRLDDKEPPATLSCTPTAGRAHLVPMPPVVSPPPAASASAVEQPVVRTSSYIAELQAETRTMPDPFAGHAYSTPMNRVAVPYRRHSELARAMREAPRMEEFTPSSADSSTDSSRTTPNTALQRARYTASEATEMRNLPNLFDQAQHGGGTEPEPNSSPDRDDRPRRRIPLADITSGHPVIKKIGENLYKIPTLINTPPPRPPVKSTFTVYTSPSPSAAQATSAPRAEKYPQDIIFPERARDLESPVAYVPPMYPATAPAATGRRSSPSSSSSSSASFKRAAISPSFAKHVSQLPEQFEKARPATSRSLPGSAYRRSSSSSSSSGRRPGQQHSHYLMGPSFGNQGSQYYT